MRNRKIAVLWVAALSLVMGWGGAGRSMAHCEIPCGIYGDRLRISMLKEHCLTVEKSMQQVKALSAEGAKDANQLVRWVVNKDEHADSIQDIVCQYFMHQRVKPVESGNEKYQGYVEQITLLHGMLVEAMKCKQTTDEAHVQKLRSLISRFESAYFGEEAEHDHK
jgi:nickel superoxide dismutase